MNIIDKINKSRYNLKKFLEKEWDVSVIEDYSNKEIEEIYNNKVLKKQNLITFGQASSLNITLQHRELPSHNLHIIYYNFPELNSKQVKVTKTCADKIHGLYENEIIKKDDSIILIILEKVSENLTKSIEDLYNNGQEILINEGLSEDIIKDNDLLDDNKKLLNEHFRNIHIFYLNHLSIDITQHVNVPKHNCIRGQIDKKKILERCNANENQLPIILRTDPQAKILRLAPGDICKIIRNTKTGGENIYYRICR